MTGTRPGYVAADRVDADEADADEVDADATDEVDADEIRRVVLLVEDPELAGVSIGDLGMVLDVRVAGPRVEVDLAPTFLGCVAVGLISLDIEGRVLGHSPAIRECTVNIVHSTWSTDRITARGEAGLKELGIVVVRPGEFLEQALCPYCHRPGLTARGGTGPTRCRTVAWCNGCRTVVEAMQPKSSNHLAVPTGHYVHI